MSVSASIWFEKRNIKLLQQTKKTEEKKTE